MRALGRYDKHAPENTARLVRHVCALLNLECPSVPATTTARHEKRVTRLELPSRRLVAGAACNSDAWEDLKVVVWDIPRSCSTTSAARPT